MVPTPISSRNFLLELPSRLDRQVQKPDSPGTGPAPGTLEMLPLLLPLLWAGSLGKDPGYELRVPESVTVQEGLCVRVPCTVTYPQVGGKNSTPARGSWFVTKDKSKQKEVLVATNDQTEKAKRKARFSFHFSGDPGDNNCSLSITDAQKSHRGKYYFRLERGPVNHSYQSNPVMVDVTELTQIPDIRIKEPLESGCPAYLTCSMPGACEPLTVSWTGAVLRPLGLDQAAYNSSEILLTPRPQDHGTNLTCRVTFPRTGSRERTLTLNVSYAPRNLTISVSRGSPTELEYVGNGSSLPVREGDSLRLLCVADSNPPATLSWARGGRTLSPSQPWSPGVLQLSRVELRHEGEFSCQAEHPRGSLRVSLRLSVHYPPRLLGPSCSWEGEGLRCSCSSRAEPAPSLRWRLGESLLQGDPSTASYTVTSSSAGPWVNSSLNLLPELSAGLRLSCEAENVQGAQSAGVLLLPLPGKPALGEAFLLGAVAGAGVAGLLSLCLCFIFFKVKTHRKDAPEPAAGGKDAPSLLGPTSWGHQLKRPPGSHRDHRGPAPAAPTSGEEHELHYAALSFQGLRPCEPPNQEATSTTEYAEIKIRE